MTLTPAQANGLIEAAVAAGVDPATVMAGQAVEEPEPTGPTAAEVSKMSLKELAAFEAAGGSIDAILASENFGAGLRDEYRRSLVAARREREETEAAQRQANHDADPAKYLGLTDEKEGA